MPTPGVAPREDARYADIRRRALEPRREPLPTRVEDVPELPSAAIHALDAGLPALDLELTPDARQAIEGHARLLLAWTVSINLTAIRDPEAVATAHVIDSLTAVEALAARGIDQFLDLGSGGGYPGLPLAAALPAERALLVEPIAKKVRFLETVIAATGLADRVEAAAVRAEALAADPRHRGRWPAVTARAVAPLAELVELSFPLLAPGRDPRRVEAGRPRGRGGRRPARDDSPRRRHAPGRPGARARPRGSRARHRDASRPRAGCVSARSGCEAPPTVVTPPLLR